MTALAQATERERMLRRRHDDTPPRERAECDVCFLLDQLSEMREVVRACEARMAPGWKPVVDIVGSSPKEEEDGA